jgi:hypothetical protein
LIGAIEMPVFGMTEAIHDEARSSFVPRDARHAYIQVLSVILQYRTGYQVRKEGSIGRNLCRKVINEAREMKRAIEATDAL